MCIITQGFALRLILNLGKCCVDHQDRLAINITFSGEYLIE